MVVTKALREWASNKIVVPAYENIIFMFENKEKRVIIYTEL